LLQEAFPYYLTDIGAQIIMLEAKDVDAPYIRRKICYLKILVLLNPENPQLLQKVGIAFFELGMVYVELINIRREFSHALNFLQRALKLVPRDTTTLNVLGQICYLMGDYAAVQRYWQGVIDLIPDCEARQVLLKRVTRVANGETPRRPLIDDLEAIGVATEHFAAQEYRLAAEIMNRLEEEGGIPAEVPSPEFFYFLALCREKCAEDAAAFEAYQKALAIDPAHQASSEAIDRITSLPGR
jgi:tetratricopeptide (TPR) repeat protein